MECRQSAVSNWSGLWLLRHVLLMAGNCRVIAVMSPFGFAYCITVMVSPHSAATRLVVAAVSSEIADAAAKTALMAVVNSAKVAEQLLVFAGHLAACAACTS